MAIEIELKARIENEAPLLDRLNSAAEKQGEYWKEDIYFSLREDSPSKVLKGAFRVRQEKGQWTVTHKTKKLENALETNEETEFTISDFLAFRKLMSALGYNELYRKTKRGVSFLWKGVHIEVGHVGSLGTFAELEVLLPDAASVEEQEKAKGLLSAALQEFQIPVEALEERTYAQLLFEVKSTHPAAP